MKQYLIDGFRLEDYEKIKSYCDENFGSPSLGTIYWVELDKDILSPLQASHEDCRPHVFALELDEKFLSCELLVRIKKNIKCDCMAYADAQQREWLISKIDAILDVLDITI